MNARLLPLVLLSLLLFACQDSSVAPPETGVIMPLKVGNIWVGHLTLIDKDGSTLRQLSDTIRVVKEVTINGETWYGTSTGELYINRADGLWMATGDSVECQCKIAKYPAQKGDTVKIETLPVLLSGGDEEIDSIPTLVTAVNAPITVPAGTFSVYRYQPVASLETGTKLVAEIEYDFAPNVGMIRRDIRYASSQRILWELTSVTLK